MLGWLCRGNAKKLHWFIIVISLLKFQNCFIISSKSFRLLYIPLSIITLINISITFQIFYPQFQCANHNIFNIYCSIVTALHFSSPNNDHSYLISESASMKSWIILFRWLSTVSATRFLQQSGRDKSKYAGKRYRDWNAGENYAQKSMLTNISLPIYRRGIFLSSSPRRCPSAIGLSFRVSRPFW